MPPPPAKWKDVVASEKYQALDEEEKSKVRQRYFDNVISKDPVYGSLPDTEKLKVQERFFGDVPQSFADRALSQTKDFMLNRPAEGAAVLRDAAVEAVGAPSESDIEAAAAQTGEVPVAKIAGRVAAQTASELIPLTPTEWAYTILGGKALEMGASKIAPILAEKFPNLVAALKRPISELMPFGERTALSELGAVAPEVPPAPAPEIPPVRAPETPAPSIVPPVEGTPPVSPAPAAAAPPAPELPPPPPGAAEKITQAGTQAVPEKDIFGQQLKKFDVADDARAVFDETSKLYEKNIDAARRGKIDFVGTKQLADDLGMDYETLVKRNKGQAFNAEQLDAAKGLVGRSLTDVIDARNAYAAEPTEENLAKMMTSIARNAAAQESFLGARAEAGRALSILRRVTEPADQAAQNFSDVLKAVGGKEGVPEEVAKRLAMIDPTDVGALNKFVRSVVKAKTVDQVYEVWLNGLLSSPLTHMRNISGNTAFLASKPAETLVQSLYDRGASIFTGKRTMFAGEAPAEVYGFLRGISDGTQRFLQSLKGAGEAAVSKFDMARVPAVPGKLGEAIRIPSKMLEAEDEFAKAVVSRMELSAQAYRVAKQEGLKGGAFINRVAELEANPTDDMLHKTAEETLYRTFQDPSKIADRLSALRDIPGVRYILPFVKTPVNIASRAVERSPIGFFKALIDGAQGKGQEIVTKDLARATLGSGIAATIAYNVMQGNVTGAPPKDANARDRFFRNRLPYAIKIGDTWHSYASFEPWSMVVGATADAVLKTIEAKQEDDATLTHVAGAISGAIGRYLVSRTFLSGISDLINAMSDGERFGDAFIKRVGSGVVPYSGMMRYITYQLDPTIRDTAGLKEQIQSGIPGMSESLPAKLDVYGEEVKRPTNPLATIGLPSKRETLNPLDQEDTETDRQTGFPGRTMAGVKLRDDEYHTLVATSGKLFKEARTALQGADGWKDIPSEGRKQIIDRLAEATRIEARHQIYFDVLDRVPEGDRRNNLMEYGAKNLGVSVDDLLKRKAPAK